MNYHYGNLMKHFSQTLQISHKTQAEILDGYIHIILNEWFRQTSRSFKQPFITKTKHSDCIWQSWCCLYWAHATFFYAVMHKSWASAGKLVRAAGLLKSVGGS